MAKKKDLFEKWVEAGEVENNLAIVQSLSMQGQSIDQIAKAFNISRRTLQYLQKEHPALKKLMEKVMNGDTTAIIYALKVYGGNFFNDRNKIEAKITGSSVAQPQVQIYLPATDTGVDSSGEKKI